MFVYVAGSLTYLPAQAEEELTLAFYHCHVGAHSNQE